MKTLKKFRSYKNSWITELLADNNINTKVKGLNEFPKNDLPPLIVHYFFDLMVAMGIFCFIVSGIFILALLIKNYVLL